MKKVTTATTKRAAKDQWVAAAMTDDQMVVELLIRLKHAGTTVSENPWTNLPPLQWGTRRRRSRPSRFGGGVLVTLKKDVDSARGSPKTPLSWSGGASASPSADGLEDISRQASCSTSTVFGSKVLSLSFFSSKHLLHYTYLFIFHRSWVTGSFHQAVFYSVISKSHRNISSLDVFCRGLRYGGAFFFLFLLGFIRKLPFPKVKACFNFFFHISYFLFRCFFFVIFKNC